MRFLAASIVFFTAAVAIAEVSMGVTDYFHSRISQIPLVDLGHAILPEVWLGHYTLLTLVIALWYMGIMTFLWTHKHAYSIFTLQFLALGTLLFMRSFSIMVTIQPSPFGHLPPPEWAFSYRNLFPNLGDNMFSGHTCFATVAYICFTDFYASPGSWGFIISSILWMLQLLWITASHLHYTVDVVIAVYLCFTLWFALRGYVPFPLPSETTIDRFLEKQFYDDNKLIV